MENKKRMRGMDLVKKINLMSQKVVYSIQFFIGGLDMVECGFKEPHKDQFKATFALDELEKALEKKLT